MNKKIKNKIKQSIEFYEGYEIFRDPSYYDMVAYRKKGEKDFNATNHVDTFKEARKAIDNKIKNTEEE